MRKPYQTPLCEVIEIELENLLCDSLFGDDSNDMFGDLETDYL